MCMHHLTLHPNLKHAIERVERSGGSHEGVGTEKKRVERPGGSHEGVGRKNYLWN